MTTTLPRDSRNVPVQVLRPGTTHTVSVGASSAASGIISDVDVVRIISTTDCHIVFGAGPVATSSDTFLPANVPEYFKIGDLDDGSTIQQVGVIQSSSSGTLYITEME